MYDPREMFYSTEPKVLNYDDNTGLNDINKCIATKWK